MQLQPFGQVRCGLEMATNSDACSNIMLGAG